MPHRHPALLASPPSADGRLYLTNVALFDGTGADLRPAAAVLIEDGKIAHVGQVSDPVPEGASVIDLGGMTLLPGLADCHQHVSGRLPEKGGRGAEDIYPATAHYFLAARLRETLRMGVLTLRDVGSQGNQPQEARQAMRYGALRGPRLLTCAKIISATAPGGRFYGDMYWEADGPAAVRAAVREQVRRGADFVKVMTTGARSNELEDPEPTQFTDEEFAAIVSEAHRLGFRVAAHAEGIPGCVAAIQHGMDTIEHGMYLDERPDLLEEMAARGQVLVPTLSGYYWMAGKGEAVNPDTARVQAEMPPQLVALANHNLERGARSMRAARAAGVQIAMGSDGVPVRGGAALEMLRMIFHGMPASEVLRSATSVAARAMGLEDHIGSVSVGKLADLVVVDGDPTTEPELLLDPRRIWLVIQHGEPVCGAALERQLERNGMTS